MSLRRSTELNLPARSASEVPGARDGGARLLGRASATKVALFMRRPRAGMNFSVELFMQSVVENLSDEFQAQVQVSRFESSGLFRRLYNVAEAAFRQGQVNHVTGDVNILAVLLRKDRTLLTILDCGVIVGTPTLRKRALKLLWFTIPSRRCAAITVISHAVREQVIELIGVEPSKVHVVPVAVPSLYHHAPKPFNAERPVILQVGMGVNKNRTRLIEALAGIPCHLAMIGKVSLEHHALLARHGVEYSEYSQLSNEQMFERYSACDLVAFPSVFEGFGMPIIEGNRIGRPVVAGNVTSMPEVAGDAACLVDPFDVDSIRAGILRIIEDRAYREQLVRNGLKNCERYSGATITRQYETLYRELARASE